MGYYALTVGSVQHQAPPLSVDEGMPKYPIPVMILARLGVDEAFRPPRLAGAKLGSELQLFDGRWLEPEVAVEACGFLIDRVHEHRSHADLLGDAGGVEQRIPE